MREGHRPSKTELRRGLVEQIRRPVPRVRSLSKEELHLLGHDPDDGRQPIGLHDSADPLLD